MGLEPTIFGLGGQRVIHCATPAAMAEQVNGRIKNIYILSFRGEDLVSHFCRLVPPAMHSLKDGPVCWSIIEICRLSDFAKEYSSRTCMLSRLALLAPCQTPMFRPPDLDHAHRQIKIHGRLRLSRRGMTAMVVLPQSRRCGMR